MSAALQHDPEDQQPNRTTKVSSKNQITLPVAALTAAHVKAGDVLRVTVVGDGVLRLVRQEDAVLALIGSAPGLSAATNLEELRNEWEK
ncbi:AbrB/MazE/SpoVT family DNA-binding domain-containing protein [Kutzneria sp. NPDC052558]|uniref:AbrB/MazE/SpoVT family DNA-binding domain-containing protein n=1 Tax=Kutzneria sp. NPDC052558 TaxID=3364121 RepID=UPI0037CA36B1